MNENLLELWEQTFREMAKIAKVREAFSIFFNMIRSKVFAEDTIASSKTQGLGLSFQKSTRQERPLI